MKQRYIDLMEKVLSAYTKEHIERYFNDVKINGLKEHGFPRLTANIGILMAHGRVLQYKQLFEAMMNLCCNEFLKMKQPSQGNDFSVREIIFCLLELEKSRLFPKEKTEYWRKLLSKINYKDCYDEFAKEEIDTKVHNRALFTTVSEYMRHYIGVADTLDFVETQIPTQLYYLDGNGMYRDPHEPMVYDLVSRSLFSVLLSFGYKGKYYNEISESLRKAGLLSLKMQSVSGEIPYGGRSDQFLFNDALHGIIFEFEASRYKKEGNLKLAGRFKSAVDISLSSIERWLENRSISHIKNLFPVESKYGCENYAYFDKYMVTCASFLYCGYVLCDEEIKPYESSDSLEVFSLSNYFHKSFIRGNKWFAEMEIRADKHYDSNGIGRIHYSGAPEMICISTPGTATPAYMVDLEEKHDFAVTPGVKLDKEIVFATDNNVSFAVENKTITDEKAELHLKCDFAKFFNEENSHVVDMIVSINEKYFEISVKGDETIALMLPAFDFDGNKHTEIRTSDNCLEIVYKDWMCRYVTTGQIKSLNKKAGNRNGYYDLYCAEADKHLRVAIEIKKYGMF